MDEYIIEVTLKESTGYDQTSYNFTVTIKEREVIPPTYIQVSNMALNNSGELLIEFDQSIVNWFNFTVDKELLDL